MHPNPIARRVGRQRVFVTALIVMGIGNLFLPPSLLGILPVDYLILCSIIVTLSIVFNRYIHAADFRAFGVTLLFILSLVPAIVAADLNPYAIEKLITIALTVAFLVAPHYFIDKQWAMKEIVRIVAWVSGVLGALLLLLDQTDYTGRAVLFDLNPIGIGRVTALLSVVAMVTIMFRTYAGARAKLASWCCLALSVIATVSTGSRGPLVSAAIAVLAVFVVLMIRKNVSHIAVVFLALGATIVTLVLSTFIDAESSRIFSAGDSGRLAIFRETLEVAAEHPMGVGWGQLSHYLAASTISEGFRVYPHNIFLEFLVEGGILALFGLVVLTGVAIRSSWKAALTGAPVCTLIFALLVYSLVNAQFSSDMVGNRLMWMMMGIALVSIHGACQPVEESCISVQQSDGKYLRHSKGNRT